MIWFLFIALFLSCTMVAVLLPLYSRLNARHQDLLVDYRMFEADLDHANEMAELQKEHDSMLLFNLEEWYVSELKQAYSNIELLLDESMSLTLDRARELYVI